MMQIARGDLMEGPAGDIRIRLLKLILNSSGIFESAGLSHNDIPRPA
jgi:hypothetical protein